MEGREEGMDRVFLIIFGFLVFLGISEDVEACVAEFLEVMFWDVRECLFKEEHGDVEGGVEGGDGFAASGVDEVAFKFVSYFFEDFFGSEFNIVPVIRDEVEVGGHREWEEVGDVLEGREVIKVDVFLFGIDDEEACEEGGHVGQLFACYDDESARVEDFLEREV